MNACAHHQGVPKSTLSKWIASADTFESLKDTSLRRYKRLGAGRKANFQDAEKELFRKFLHMRTVEGVPVDIYWLRFQMRLILGSEVSGKFFFSNGWAAGFCKRWGISSQVRTEKKRLTVLERLPVIKQFHYDVYHLQRCLPEQCPIYGAFPPTHIWNMDQVPFPFCINPQHTYGLGAVALLHQR